MGDLYRYLLSFMAPITAESSARDIGGDTLYFSALCLNGTKKETRHAHKFSQYLFARLPKVCFLLLLLLSVEASRAQTAASYGFSAFTRPYSGYPFTGYVGGSDLTSTSICGNDLIFNFIVGGFTISFNFCGVTYTTLNVCSNGFISFSNGTAAPHTNTPDSITGPGMLMPFCGHLTGQYGSTVWYCHCFDSGYAPHRTFIFEWSVAWFPYSYPSSGTPGRLQVRLYETSNIIEFCYDTATGYGTTFSGTSATIGIANSTTDWQTLNNSSSSPTPSSSVFTDTLSMGPASNQVYRWNPNLCSGTPSAGAASATDTAGCTAYGSVLSLSGTSGIYYGINYQWQSSPNSITWTNISGATNTTDSVTVTATTWYRCKATCSLSGLSGYSPGIKLVVHAAPAGIAGPATVCMGSAITLTDSTAGGSWSAGSGIVVPGSAGVITGISAGATTISYTLPTGCFTATAITVNPIAAITGVTTLCAGSNITLGDSVAGGTWSAGGGAASVGSATGTVTGTSAGTSTITYTLATGCKATRPITVNPAPAMITGTMNVCAGLISTLSDSTSGGVWSSINLSVATIGSGTGLVNGLMAGTAVVSYTLPGGCAVGTTVTVNPLPGGITVHPLMPGTDDNFV